ncbi:MAG: hypothetical protein JO364_21240 [Pseudonocardiales bacterium]|nr:hypothetical protein [Pseudonocardiales bacterium]MBV9032774.1 hypothetical protein [Pseudonocardiales bacterium]
MTSTPRERALVSDDLGGAVVRQVLRAGGKSVLALGERDGRAVVIKELRADEELWRARFDHEIRLYQAFTQNPPPVRVPELVHTDGHRVLVIEHIPGRPVDAERYPEQPLPPAVLDLVLDTISVFNRWTPPDGVLAPVFDYPERIARDPRRHHAVRQGIRTVDGCVCFGRYAHTRWAGEMAGEVPAGVAWLPTTIPTGTQPAAHPALAAALDTHDDRPVVSLYGYAAPWKVGPDRRPRRDHHRRRAPVFRSRRPTPGARRVRHPLRQHARWEQQPLSWTQPDAG